MALVLAPRHAIHAAFDLVTGRAYFRPRRIRQLETAADGLSQKMTLARRDRTDREANETLRMVCTFEMEPPADRQPDLYELLNNINDQ